ncbi:uncharacterized protein HMPREF1541_03629 [Cyphellophora europaea CBS 101466]|uniref:RRM domain-containing protein n=1 Tax=Cyphellophora europaea (strain CBS 101466) TaxID=1220924 RepID=W2S0W9_CYPE1|nr:uncharacterized protein HMPREF1541_03629 [Cyphellophora europaea CBS 101466]ETN41693.1 hypothetical protein HMPREF1541_03629 [Cyphellophora europaea CBS 101466]
MEDMPLPMTDSRPGYGSERRGFGGSGGGGFGDEDEADRRSERQGYSVREQLPMPTAPPYTAHLANLSFDALEDDVNDFFRDCEVKEVRIVKDKMDDKPKGFGYVTFDSLEGLKTALNLSGGSLAGRAVRVSVAEPPKDRVDPSRDLSDWSRKGPLPDLPNQRRVSDRPTFNRFDDNRSDAGSERGGRRGFEPSGDGKVRDFGNWERRGPLPATPGQGTSLRDGGRQQSKNGPDFRHNSPSWGEGRSQDGSRPPRRDQDRPAVDRQPTAPELDNEWRSGMKAAPAVKSPTPDDSNPPSPRPAAAPATRPRLNLQKRTVSEAEPATSPAPGSDSKASPFGAAKPIDTAARERAVEEKRQLVIRERKEAEEKARAEKAEEKRQTREKGESDKPESPKATKQTPKGEEDEEKPAGPKFDILRRAESGTNDMIADDQDEDVAPTDDKAVKPKEIVVPASQANGSWRKAPGAKSPGPKSPEASTAEALEEDGWSTVSKPGKQRNNRRGGPRAIAS